MEPKFEPVKVLLITNADYDDANKYIVSVKAITVCWATNAVNSESKSKFLTREDILDFMDKGYLILTVIAGPNGEIAPAAVSRFKYHENGKQSMYLSTRTFCEPCDNIGALPQIKSV